MEPSTPSSKPSASTSSPTRSGRRPSRDVHLRSTYKTALNTAQAAIQAYYQFEPVTLLPAPTENGNEHTQPMAAADNVNAGYCGAAGLGCDQGGIVSDFGRDHDTRGRASSNFVVFLSFLRRGSKSAATREKWLSAKRGRRGRLSGGGRR